ncbi:hypothetical protein N7489_008369 [Penicillium chrysogenum]|uniref:uncharacterized protein n=1 Tax=Penicillium chrysogenum TaxID=5076 RepID=UPI0024DF1EB7|nr:uncharacterized protein N7489_008369 [Penicillium chrysogenum]KAJ5227661.1 hypothetical protein N7489_008369 [Penicillium chrysogenum]
MLRRRPVDERDWSGWSPMEAQAWKTDGCLTAPPGTLARNWESRKAFAQAPWRAPPEVTIEDRETAMNHHNKILLKNSEQRPLILYTDGSGIDGKIGAAAIVNPEKEYAHSQMGDEETSTVYAAELRAIEMALALVLLSTEPRTVPAKNRLVIFADSQAALKALSRPRMPSGQVYLKRPKNLKDHRTLTIGISVSQPRPKRRIRGEAKIEWEKLWTREKTSRLTKRLIEAPTRKTLAYWSGLRKATASILMQLRTGRIGLRAYLNRINRSDSARCDCDLGNQTMRHALSDRGVALRRDNLLERPEARTIVAEFVVRTGLLDQFQAVDPVALGMEEGDETE